MDASWLVGTIHLCYFLLEALPPPVLKMMKCHFLLKKNLDSVKASQFFFDEDWFDSEASQPFAWMRTDSDGGQRFNYKLGQFYDTLQSHLD